MLSVGFACGQFVCRRSLRFRTEGFCGTALRIGSRACDEGGISRTVLLVYSLSWGCQAMGGRLSCRVRLSFDSKCPERDGSCNKLSVSFCHRSFRNSMDTSELRGVRHVLGFGTCLVGAIGVELLRRC